MVAIFDHFLPSCEGSLDCQFWQDFGSSVDDVISKGDGFTPREELMGRSQESDDVVYEFAGQNEVPLNIFLQVLVKKSVSFLCLIVDIRLVEPWLT